MPAYIARRLVQVALILLGVAAITYLLLYMLPADPARMVAGRSATKDQVDLVRTQLGLDRPIWEQFGRLSVEAVAGRSRPLLPAAHAGDRPAGSPPARFAAADGGRHLLRAGDRPDAWNHCRAPAQLSASIRA